MFVTFLGGKHVLSGMLRFERSLVCVGCLLFIVTSSLAAPKVTTIGPCTDSSLGDSVKKVLAAQGYKVTFDDGSSVQFWPRGEITAPGKAREDATYPLARSTFLGVIDYEKSTRDYRGDAIPAGYYSLRYELQPNDGDHLGTSPTPDFLLLVAPAADTDPEHAYDFQQLVDLSRQVTGKKHPAPLNLVPADAKEFPSVATDPDDHTILFFKVKTRSGDLPMALVVKGTTTQ